MTLGGDVTNEITNKQLYLNPTIEIGAGFLLLTRHGGQRQSVYKMKDDPEFCRLIIQLGSDEWSPEKIQEIPQYLLERLIEAEVIVPVTAEELYLNPTIEIGAGFTLRTRHDGAKQNIYKMKDDPEFCRLIIQLGSDEWSPEKIQEIPQYLLERLIEAKVIVPKEEIVYGEPFHYVLDTLPLDLVPIKYKRSIGSDKDINEYVVNSRIYIQIGSDLPSNLADRIQFCDQFQGNNGVIWIEDPGTMVLASYWLGTQFMELIQRLCDGQIKPSDLPAQVSERLACANILVPKDYENARVEEWQERCKRLSAKLQSEQYVIIRNMVHPLQLAALRRYFRQLDQKGYLLIDTRMGNNRRVWQNDGVARFVHYQITQLINRLVPEPIKPSYCFLSAYKPGAILKRHTDRAQCEWNLSLLIDTNPEVELSDSWPLNLEIEGKVKAARLDMGDGVLYRGTRILHWRDALPEGHIATLILCHFVPIDFSDSLN
jgi:hypothetical protein